MVTHDYERGMITGLPRSVVDEVRRTGKLPRGAIHPSMVDVWDALAEQRRHQLPPGMTVADIQRQRDGWDEAFDPEVWERLSGEKGAVPPPAGPTPPENTPMEYADCRDVARLGFNTAKVPESTRLEIPAQSRAQPCAARYPGTGCEAPLWNVSGTDRPCQMSDATLAAVSRPIAFTGCDPAAKDLISRAWCMLYENVDLAVWATCVAFGEKEWLFSPITVRIAALISQAIPFEVGCGKDHVDEDILAQAVFWITFFVDHPHFESWLDQMADPASTEADRLCTVLNVAHVLFHEMLHLASGLEGYDGGASSAECPPVWVAQSLMRGALLARYPAARQSACCDKCLSEAFYAVPVPAGQSPCGRDHESISEGVEPWDVYPLYPGHFLIPGPNDTASKVEDALRAAQLEEWARIKEAWTERVRVRPWWES